MLFYTPPLYRAIKHSGPVIVPIAITMIIVATGIDQNVDWPAACVLSGGSASTKLSR